MTLRARIAHQRQAPVLPLTSAGRHRNTAAALTLFLLLSGLAACGSGGDTGTSDASNEPSSQTSAVSAETGSSQTSAVSAETGSSQTSAVSAASTVADMVPDAVRKKGTLIALLSAYPTAVILPPGGGPPTGFDPSLAAELGKLMNLRIDLQVLPFTGLIPALKAHRGDIIMGQLSINDERRKQFSFVSETVGSFGLLTLKSKNLDLSTELNLCGKKAGVSAGTLQLESLQKVQADCAAAGKPAMTISTYSGDDLAILALKSGRTDFDMNGIPSMKYQVQQEPDTFKYVPITEDWATKHDNGIALANEPYTPDLARALAAAMNELISNGTYAQLCAKWLAPESALKQSEVLPQTT